MSGGGGASGSGGGGGGGGGVGGSGGGGSGSGGWGGGGSAMSPPSAHPSALSTASPPSTPAPLPVEDFFSFTARGAAQPADTRSSLICARVRGITMTKDMYNLTLAKTAESFPQLVAHIRAEGTRRYAPAGAGVGKAPFLFVQNAH
jgi:hypothetical protein